MTKQHIIRQHPIRLAILIITLILLVSATIFSGKIIDNALYNNADASANKTINELTNLLTHNVTSEINSYTNSLSTISSALSYIKSDKERLDFLQEMSLKENNIKFGLADSSGSLHIIGTNDVINVSSKNYFKDTIKGNATTDIYKYKEYGNTIISFVFAYPVCSPGSDVPDSVICEFVDTEVFFKSLRLDINTIQVILSNTNNPIIVSTDYISETDNPTLPLDRLIKDSNVISLLDNSIKPSKDSLINYNIDNTSQYIYRSAITNNWTLYASINPKIIYLDTSGYITKISIINILLIISILISIIMYILPLIREASQRHVAESRSMLLANVSHELRTPLNTIIGISEIMARSELTDGQIREISYISDAGKNLLAMINDLLDYTKLQSNKFEIVEDIYDLESLVYDMTTVATIRLNDKPVEFLVYISSYVPRHMIGDLLRVRQIINNIITNAVKYTERGHITVTIDCDYISDNELQLIVTVTDTGIGIKKDDLSRLFDDFTRFDSNKNKNIEGSGLGMSIAAKFAELMSGTINVESIYGEGSVFTINIIQHVTDKEPLIPEYLPKESYDNILMLEKSPILSDYYSRCLEDTLVNYDITNDNYDFSTLFNKNKYNYVLADAATISMMRGEFQSTGNNDVHFISLVHNNSSTLKDGDTLYVPLFSLQLFSYLSGQKRPDHNYSLDQSFIIHPMPEKHILVVDDNFMNLQVATGIMEPYHMQIDCADSGKKALKLVQEKAYDLVFMDHMMPEMDGEETMHVIRKVKYFNCQTMPIIVLTANASSGAHEMFINMGFQDFIPKPLEIRTLHALLYKWLKPENTEEAIEYRPQEPEIEETDYEDLDIIDFKEGLARIGSMPIYLKTLRNFCDTIPKKKEVISRSFPDDMKTFVIEVHGLKGVAAIVSANELTKQSLELEMMGKSENLQGIEPLLDDYYDYMIEVKMSAERFIEDHT